MNFKLGFYRTRDGSIVELTRFTESLLVGRVVVPLKDRRLYWNENGDALYYDKALDLIEYLKVKENGTHEGPSLESYIEEISKK